MSLAETLVGGTRVTAVTFSWPVGSFLENLIKIREHVNARTNWGRPGNVGKRDKPRNEPSPQTYSTGGNCYLLYVAEARSDNVREGGATKPIHKTST